MNQTLLHSDLRLLALVLSANSLMGLFFLWLAGAIGGAVFFDEALLGKTISLLFLGLFVLGISVAYGVRARKA